MIFDPPYCAAGQRMEQISKIKKYVLTMANYAWENVTPKDQKFVC